MEANVYEKLRQRLDVFPTGFPKTPEGIEFKILKKLFSEEEAGIACGLPLMGADSPENLHNVSWRAGKNIDEVSRLLGSMAKKGLVYVKGDKESMAFALLPFVPGIFEFSADIVDAELADLFQKYIFGPMSVEMGKTKAPLLRIVPVNQSISSQATIHPYEDVVKAIEMSSSICVMPCACRTSSKLLGEGCDYPEETCIFLNEFADYLNNVGKGRRLTKEEAIDIITMTEEVGLIHLSDNTQRPGGICSCCGCCCLGLKGIIQLAKAKRLDLGPKNPFRLVLDTALCSGCESCIDRCWTEALSMEDGIAVHDPERCIACGACAYVCPTDALYLEKDPGEEAKPLPRDYGEMFSQMGWRTGI